MSPPRSDFATTHWSRILAARDHGTPGADEALEELCRDYWRPLHAYIRRRGYGPEDAQDLTQGFFEQLLAKDYLGDLTPGRGRFRSFLLVSLQHYLANQWDRVHCKKRGGGRLIVSIEAQSEEGNRFEPHYEVTPEREFEFRWAVALVAAVVGRLEAEMESGGSGIPFEELRPFLGCDQEPGLYGEIARRRGLKETTVKVAVHRLRRRYGQLLRDEVRRTLADPNDVEAELRHLIRSLGQRNGYL